MKETFKELQQNKGMSLMEILISVAISMIVMVVAATFISNGSVFFKKQSKTIDLQNELMEVSNKINDAVIQATDELEIQTGTGANGVKIYTGAYDLNNNKFTSGKGSARYIEWNSTDKTLYAMDVLEMSDEELKKGYLMGSHVQNVSISIADECQVVQLDGSIRYKQPLVLKISVTVSKDDETRRDLRVVTVRNKLDKLTMNGVVYESNEDDLLTKVTIN